MNCDKCGAVPVEIDKDDMGCLWPDGEHGCWSGPAGDGFEHLCERCGRSEHPSQASCRP